MLLHRSAEKTDEFMSISVVEKDVALFDATARDVPQRSGEFDSEKSRHTFAEGVEPVRGGDTKASRVESQEYHAGNHSTGGGGV